MATSPSPSSRRESGSRDHRCPPASPCTSSAQHRYRGSAVPTLRHSIDLSLRDHSQLDSPSPHGSCSNPSSRQSRPARSTHGPAKFAHAGYLQNPSWSSDHSPDPQSIWRKWISLWPTSFVPTPQASQRQPTPDYTRQKATSDSQQLPNVNFLFGSIYHQNIQKP